MNDKKKIGFDILENSDINTIEEIGTGKMNIDKNARERMLKNTMKKYEAEKKKLGITQDTSSENNENADSVTGVEIYERKKLPHFIYIGLCSAAAIALTIGSITMLNRRKPDAPEIQTPVAQVTSTAATTSVSSSTTAASSKEAVTVTATETSASSAATKNTATTTSAANASDKTGDDTETAAGNAPSDTTVSAAYTNPHTDRTDITQEELDAAAVRAVKQLINYYDGFPNVAQPDPTLGVMLRYAFYDVNGDSVPELFIRHNYSLGNSYMYVFDGNDYVTARFNGHDREGNDTVHETVLSIVDALSADNTIGMMGHQGGSQSFILHMGADNTITPICEYTFNRTYKDGKLSEEYTSDGDLDKFSQFLDLYRSYGTRELNWIGYDLNEN
ncbi:MAG: hypothetical protein IKH96_03375 [Ruminococcus sp.]|uniref:hypothetical protein n=1 Tax=Ruminococcus sp. TaxID=41978 RepID=UPI0025F11854|nr:hypothetical protein [Ruminococcus sp.]MBR6995040.1 hypothetical protein [Ruminococcus sp.]